MGGGHPALYTIGTVVSSPDVQTNLSYVMPKWKDSWKYKCIFSYDIMTWYLDYTLLT
jgi:hypothetical protein